MSLPNWYGQKDVKKRSAKKEKAVAKDLGGSTQPGSGAFHTAKGDIKLDDFLIEHKFTDSKSYSLTIQTFNKIQNEAFSCGKLPAMVIEIEGKKLVVMRYEDVT